MKDTHPQQTRDLHIGPVDQVLVLAPDDDLPGDDHLVVLLVAQRRPDQVNW